jgi:hypothetical protein
VSRIANNTNVQVFRYGNTEVLKQCDISTRIRDLLRPEWPLIILVHDEDSIRTLLGNLGIDTDGFSSGIKSLLQ